MFRSVTTSVSSSSGSISRRNARVFGWPASKRTTAAATLVPTRMRRVAADIEFHAQEIWCADLWSGRADGAGIEIPTYQLPVRLSEINAEQYRERVTQACDFLEGHSREMISTLESEMRKAAEKMDFEKAAELRNMVNDLRSTTRPTRRFTRGSLPSAIDPMADVRALADALRLPDAPRVMECFDISNISTTHVVASMVVSGMAYRTRTIIVAIACAPSKGRTTLRAWPK